MTEAGSKMTLPRATSKTKGKWGLLARRGALVCPRAGGRQSLGLRPRCQGRRWDQLFIQQKPFIHSEINHWVYSADIKKNKERKEGKASHQCLNLLAPEMT